MHRNRTAAFFTANGFDAWPAPYAGGLPATFPGYCNEVTVSTHPHGQLIEKFYAAFSKRDAETMVSCYHPSIHFSDSVFHDLRGPRAGAMWKMLCERATTLTIESSGIAADDKIGRAHWEARYDFTATGRKVHNVIDARFEFADGKIIRHADTFERIGRCGFSMRRTQRSVGENRSG